MFSLLREEDRVMTFERGRSGAASAGADRVSGSGSGGPRLGRNVLVTALHS